MEVFFELIFIRKVSFGRETLLFPENPVNWMFGQCILERLAGSGIDFSDMLAEEWRWKGNALDAWNGLDRTIKTDSHFFGFESTLMGVKKSKI